MAEPPSSFNLGLYYRIKKTQLELTRDRGYQITDPAELAMLNGVVAPDGTMQPVTRDQMTRYYWSLAQANGLTKFFPGLMSGLYFKPVETIAETLAAPIPAGAPPALEYLYIYYNNEANFGKDEFTTFNIELQRVVDTYADALREVLLILQKKPTTAPGGGREGLANWSIKSKTVEVTIFTLEELAINPTKHAFAPKHYLLSPEEKAEHTRPPRQQSQMHAYRYSSFSNPGTFPADPVVKYYGWRPKDIVRIVREIFYARYPIRKEISYRSVQL